MSAKSERERLSRSIATELFTCGLPTREAVYAAFDALALFMVTRLPNESSHKWLGSFEASLELAQEAHARANPKPRTGT